MNKLKIIFFLMSIFLMSICFSQNAPLTLTLTEAVEMAKQKGLQAQINTNTYYAGLYQFKSQSVNRLPQFSLNGNLPGINRAYNSITQPDGTIKFLPQNQALSMANLNLNQQITSTGGSVFISSAINRFDLLNDNSLNSNYTNFQTAPLLMGISQPILRFNQFKFDWKIAQLRNQQNTRTYAESMEDLSIQITSKFYEVVMAHADLQQAEFNIAVNDTLMRVATGRYNLGKIGEDDLLQTELRLMNAQNSFDQSKLNFITSENQLKIMIGVDKNTPINLLTEISLPQFEPNADKAMSEAKKNRSDILSIQIDQQQTEAMLKKASLNRLPNAELIASYGLNQTAPVLSDAYKYPLDQTRATVGINIPLMNWGKNRFDYRTAKFQMDAKQAQLDLTKLNLEQDVLNQIGQYLQLRTRLTISAKADTIAQKRYAVAKNRYFIGKIDITNLNIAQTEKDQARSNYYSTMRDFWLAYYRLRRLTLYDFERNEALFKNMN
jgi:outer membrane protein TolC